MTSDTPQTQRPRGRPKGSGVRDDSVTLKRIVAEMVSNQALPQIAAMRQICGALSDTDARRLRRKLKQDGPALRNAEIARRQQRQSNPQDAVRAAIESYRQVRATIAASPFLKAIDDLPNNPEMERLLAAAATVNATMERFRLSPEMKRFQEAIAATNATMERFQQSPVGKKFEEAVAAVRAARIEIGNGTPEIRKSIEQTHAMLAAARLSGTKR